VDKQFYWNILDFKRTGLLPLFKPFKDNFYLAGGTALALQLGHRDSIDFDFFSPDSFSTVELFKKIEQVFSDHKVIKTQEEKDTLSMEIDDDIKVSFFAYRYKMVESLLDENNFKIASLADIGAMKFSAITGRSVLKDYIDIYFILQKIDLEKLLNLSTEKFPSLDINLILKSLVFFEDIDMEPILFKGEKVEFETVQKYLTEVVKRYLNSR